MGAKKRVKKEQAARAAAQQAAKKREAEQKQKSNKNRAILIAVAAVLLAAIIATAVIVLVKVLTPKANSDLSSYPTLEELMQFEYEKLNISDYLAYPKGGAAGLHVDMAKYYEDYVSRNDIVNLKVDDDAVDEQIAYLLLSARKPAGGADTAKTLVNGEVGYGDDVTLFILSATATDEEGKTVPAYDAYFVNAYSEAKTITVGAYTFGEAFDRLLIGCNPSATAYNENGETDIDDIKDDDVLRLYYTATVEGEKTPAKGASGARVMATDPVAKLFIENSKGLRTGETVSFHNTEDIDGDGKDDDVVYRGYIVSVMTEEPMTVTASLPDDYFPETGYEDYVWLNGKEITYSVILLSFTDYDAKETDALTRDDIVNLLGYKDLKAAEDDEEGAVAEYKQHVREDLEKQIADAKADYEKQALFLAMLDKFPAKDYPDEATRVIREYLISDEMGAFNYYSSYYTDFPYSSAEDFAPDYFGYDVEEFPTLNEYVAFTVEKEVGFNLTVFAVMEAEGITLSEEELEDARTRWVKEQLDGYEAQNGSATTEKALLAYYGEDNVQYLSRQMLIGEKVTEFLREAATFDYGE